MKDYKYNYVFYNLNGDLLLPVFGPLKSLSNVKLNDYAFDSSPLLNKIFFLHWSAKLNKIIKLPFKNIWYKKMCCHKFDNDRPTCYVFLGGKYIIEDENLYKYIKQINSQNKCVVLCYDLISKKRWDIDKVKNLSDYIVSFDIGESKKYDVNFFDMDIYGPITEVTTPSTFEYDVYFLGYAKDRIKKIYDVYNYLVDNGLRCKFLICGAKKEEQVEYDGVEFCNPIPYEQNLEYVKKSKCLLEIMQGGSSSPTLRIREALIYKRKLLTNNNFVVQQRNYSSEFISVFNNNEDIDINFLMSDINYGFFDKDFNMSSERIIEYFEKILE